MCAEFDNTPDADRSDIDCDQGRALGCQVFCCRLLVRLEPDERLPAENGLAQKGYMDKDPDGYCIHFDRERGICRIWAQRPKICRSYSCNTDPLLQVALRYPFRNLADLLRASARALIPRGTEKSIPYLATAMDGGSAGNAGAVFRPTAMEGGSAEREAVPTGTNAGAVFPQPTTGNVRDRKD